MPDDVYKRLARHLDNLPGGFPETESGVELRILRRLFTEEEAELALQLSPLVEPARMIAKRAGLDAGETADRLAEMSQKGLIFRVTRDGEPHYMALQYVIGIWEFHVNDLDPDLVRDMNEYIPHLIDLDAWDKAPQLRTIPISQDIPVEYEVLPYEQAEYLLRSRKRIAVAPCICRREHKMVGEGCDRPEEACLVFNRGADYYIENGLGREIGVEEALDILETAEETGLVLQPSNAQNVTNICCCCGCCCQVLKSFKSHPEPASLVTSPFIVSAEPETCIACGTCVERCPMDATSIVDEHVEVDLKRCIGCGLCVTRCPSGSLTLVRKPEKEQKAVPVSVTRNLMNLARVRGKLNPKNASQLALRAARNRISRGR